MSTDTTTKLQNEKVLCSAGRGEISKEGCLACALKLNNACGYDFATLNALFQDKERTGIHVTDLTGCLRKSYYEKTDSGALEYVHEMLNRFVGTAVHSFIEQFPSKEYSNEVKMNALGLTGTADIIYNNGRLIDFKTTRWMNMARLPYGSHVQQLNIYAALLRAQGKAVTSAAIQYIDLSGPSKCTGCRGPLKPEHDGIMACARCQRAFPNAHTGAGLVEIDLEPQAQVAEWIAVRLKLLEMSLEEKSAPDPEPSFLCGYCPFSQCPSNPGGQSV